MSEADFELLKMRIGRNWRRIQEIALGVPSPRRIADLIRLVGGPTTLDELGLGASDRNQALENAHYLRNHFTVSRLFKTIFPGRPELASLTTDLAKAARR